MSTIARGGKMSKIVVNLPIYVTSRGYDKT